MSRSFLIFYGIGVKDFTPTRLAEEALEGDRCLRLPAERRQKRKRWSPRARDWLLRALTDLPLHSLANPKLQTEIGDFQLGPRAHCRGAPQESVSRVSPSTHGRC